MVVVLLLFVCFYCFKGISNNQHHKTCPPAVDDRERSIHVLLAPRVGVIKAQRLTPGYHAVTLGPEPFRTLAIYENNCTLLYSLILLISLIHWGHRVYQVYIRIGHKKAL